MGHELTRADPPTVREEHHRLSAGLGQVEGEGRPHPLVCSTDTAPAHLPGRVQARDLHDCCGLRMPEVEAEQRSLGRLSSHPVTGPPLRDPFRGGDRLVHLAERRGDGHSMSNLWHVIFLLRAVSIGSRSAAYRQAARRLPVNPPARAGRSVVSSRSFLSLPPCPNSSRSPWSERGLGPTAGQIWDKGTRRATDLLGALLGLWP